ncbi:MAG: protoporphyrinogen oxidase [Anaerolineaceae bacterium]|nr:protoporphyrinogen oxidase [Anaerolineaceae bacterium]
MISANTQSRTQHIVIVGGGISGLSAAWFVQQAQQKGLDVRYTVLESSSRWGGKLLTEQVESGDEPFIIEAGPDAFLTQKPWAIQLARELGLGNRLININDQQRTTYVLHHGKPVKLPEGVALIVPTKLMPFLRSPLISWWGKLRIGLEWFAPVKDDDHDETLADFVHRRLGDEALDIFAEPMLAGIYNAETEKQSLLATFPRFRQMEREHGSVIRGTLAARRKQSASSAPKTAPFMTLMGGTQELTDTLVSKLNSDLRLQTRLASIEAAPDGRYHLTTENGDTLEADAVLLTTPAYTAADLLRPLSTEVADKLASIRYLSSGTISLAFHTGDIQYPLDGFGLVVPKSEQRPINAITLSSVKFTHRAPDGYVLLRVFFGGSRSPETMSYDNDKLLQVVQQELRTMLGIEAAPIFHRIYRWNRANPQYDLNHLELVDAIETDLPQAIYVTGAAFRGVGMPDCVYQSQQAVTKILKHVEQVLSKQPEVTA